MKFIEVSSEDKGKDKDKDKVIPLEKYIEDLKFFHDIYSKGDTNGDMAEELMVYEHVISWLEELKHYREKEKEKAKQDMKE